MNSISLDRIQGGILGSAIGDAFGKPIQYYDLKTIHRIYGVQGITELHLQDNAAQFTSNTQWMIFTIEGLLNWIFRQSYQPNCEIAPLVRNAYLRWLITQSGQIHASDRMQGDYLTSSWLLDLDGLYHQRGAGSETIQALQCGRLGTIEQPINQAKGSSCLSCAMPIALLDMMENPFQTGCELAAITHGHPLAYRSTGALALLIRHLAHGWSLDRAIDDIIYQILPLQGGGAPY